jgi:hypothetical protein
MREHNVTCCWPARQTCCWIWHVTCFEFDRPGIYIYFVLKSSHGQEIPIFFTSPRLALCPLNLPFNAYQGSFPGIRQLGCQVNHLPPSDAEVNNELSDTSTALICHHGICRGGGLSFTCYKSTYVVSDFDIPNFEYRLLFWPPKHSNSTFNSLLNQQLATAIYEVLTISHAIQITTYTP